MLPLIKTPLVRVDYHKYDSHLWVKDESICPTGTFKDRLAWKYVQSNSEVVPCGPDIVLASITLGNTMRSFAYAVRSGMPVGRQPKLFAIFPAGFSKRRIGPNARGVSYDGSRIIDLLRRESVACVEHPLSEGFLGQIELETLAHQSCDSFRQLFNISNGIGTPAYKQILIEALDEMPVPPDFILVPVGAGVLFLEFVEVVRERRLNANVIGVTVKEANSFADKIYGLYSPFYQQIALSGIATYENDARFTVECIEDSAIRSVRERGLPEGFESAEPSSWAALVPLITSPHKFTGKNVLVINTGNGLCNV